MRRMLLMLAPLMAVGLLTLSGCGGGTTPPAAGTGAGKGGGAGKSGGASGKAEAAAVSGYAASLKGKVTYNGDDKPGPKKLTPSKDQDKCPAQVDAEGWYVNPESKALQYAVVFLKAPAGVKMPKFGPNTEKPAAGQEVLQVAQPHCQFEPRVLVMHPGQKLRFINDSDPPIAHDTSVKGVVWTHGPETLPPGGKTKDLNPDASDKNPYKVSCNIHTGSMSGYIWRPTHPWMAVTDKDGNYELKDVPVLEGDKKMEIWVWHEMLPGDQTMKIGEVDVKANEPGTKDFAMPKK
jgi:plastocyanin